MAAKKSKKSKVNKSQAIRDYVSAHRSASAKEVVASLAKKNVSVTAAMVANVKSKAGLTKQRRGRKTSSKKKGTSRAEKVGGLSVEMLIEAKRLIKKAGSASKAVQAIRAIEKLESVTD
jgi:arginine repressor